MAAVRGSETAAEGCRGADGMTDAGGGLEEAGGSAVRGGGRIAVKRLGLGAAGSSCWKVTALGVVAVRRRLLEGVSKLLLPLVAVAAAVAGQPERLIGEAGAASGLDLFTGEASAVF